MYYYKINRHSSLGKELETVLKEGERVCQKAREFAEGIGATSYLIPPETDFGGIVAFMFPEWKKQNATCFDTVRDGNVTYHIPKVSVSDRVMLSGDAIKLSKKERFIVSKTEYPFVVVRGMMSRNDTAILAGLTLHTLPLRHYVLTCKITPEQIQRLLDGIPAKMVLKGLDDQVCESIDATIQEDKQINDCLRLSMFRMVQEISGTKRAVALYKSMQALPVVPSGTINHILSIPRTNVRCQIRVKDDTIYVLSDAKSKSEELIPSTREEFENK